MPIKQYLLTFCAYSIVVFTVTSPAFFAPLNFEDEHQLLNVANPDLLLKEKIPANEDFSSLKNYIVDEIKLGRLKPVSRIIPWSIAILSNANPLVLHSYLLICVTLILTLFFTFLKKLNVTPWLAFIGGLILLAGKYNEIWWRIGPGELLALLFFLIGLVSTLNYSKEKSKRLYIPVLFFALSALSKESFAFTLPVIAILLVLNKGFVGKNKSLVIGISSVFLGYCILLGLVLIINGSTYGWESDIAFFQLAKENLLLFSKPWLLWIPVVFWLIISPYKRIVLPISVAFLLWIGIQLLIHYRILVIDSTRYLLPAQLFLITVSILATNHALVLKKKVGAVLCVLIGLYCFLGLKNIYINSSYFGNKTLAYHELLQIIAKSKPKNILLILNKDESTEHVTATAFFLSKLEINTPIEYTRLHEKNKVQSIENKYYSSLSKKEHNFFTFFKSIEAKKYDAILFLEPREKIPQNFVDLREFNVRKTTEKFFNFSFKSFIKNDNETINNRITYLALIKQTKK